MPTDLRGRATPATLAHLLVSKHTATICRCIGRARSMLARGSNSTARRWGDWCGCGAAWLLDPVVEKIRQHVFAAEKIHGERYHGASAGAGTRTDRDSGRLWVYVRDDLAFLRPCERRRRPISTALIVVPSTRRRTWRTSPASFRPMATPVLRGLHNPALDQARSNYGSCMPGPLPEEVLRRLGGNHKSPVAKEALDRIAAVYAIEDKARFASGAAERVEANRRETAPLLDKFF